MAKTALVTGGTGGLGTAVVARLLDDGWRVVVPWVVERELERVPGHERLHLVQADLSDADAVAGLVETCSQESGTPLRGLVNLVGGFASGGRVHETPLSEFEDQLRLNLRLTYRVTAAALPRLIAAGGGSIVCVVTRG
jgi:NAD(P)-dependent dehydrogenase (short-subunit alcohol dehydrogenase family)